jgi:HEAT repeat protein
LRLVAVLVCGLGAHASFAQLGPANPEKPASEGEALAPPTAIERSQIRERAIAKLVEMTDDDWALIRANAIEGLIPTPGRLRDVLPEALVDLNEGVRSVAAMAVGRARLVEFAGRVEPLRHDPSPYVRVSAIYALARCGREVDPSPLAELLLAGESPRVRAQAAFVLGELGNASAVPMLKQASVAEMPLASAAEMRLLRLQIAEAMVKLGAAEEQINVVRAALFPSRPDELEATALAVQIIGNVRDQHSAGLLAQMVGGEGEKAAPARPMPAEVRLAAVGALAEMGRPQGRFAVDRYLRDPAPAIRAQAAHVLGQLGREEDLRLLETMSGRDADATVRVSAAAAIVAMGDEGGRLGSAE